MRNNSYPETLKLSIIHYCLECCIMMLLYHMYACLFECVFLIPHPHYACTYSYIMHVPIPRVWTLPFYLEVCILYLMRWTYV